MHRAPDRATDTTPDARKRRTSRTERRRRWWIAGVLVALLAYPVLGTLFLWTGLFEKMMASEDLRIEIHNPSWTLWPGHIHVAAGRVLVNGETQFDLRGRSLLLHVNLFSLFKKRLRVTSVTAHDVHYFMRVQVADKKGIEERVAAYPELRDLPGDATLIKQKAQETEKREGDFTVEIDGIDVDIAELWFMEYHYVGPGTLKGGFLVGPQRMRVSTSVQNLGPGELRFGADRVIAKNFQGRVEAQIPELNPLEHADESFLELVTADIRLKGAVETLSHVGAYTSGVRVVAGAGPFDSHILLSKGRLGDQSELTFSTEKVGIRGQGYGVDTDWDFDARVAKADKDDEPKHESDDSVLPRIHSKSKVTYVSFANEQKAVFTVQLQEHDERVVLESNQLGRMTDIDHARIRFPKIVTTDMDDLAALTSDDSSISAKAGEARASLSIDIDKQHVARGIFKATFSGLRFAAADMMFRGQGDAACQIRADLDDEVTRIDHFSFDVTELGMQAKDQEVEGWWSRIEVPKLTAWGLPPERFEGSVSVRAKSAEPVLKALVAKDEIPGIVSQLTSLNDLRIRGNFRKTPTVTDVVLEPLENDLFDVAGRYYSKGDDSRYAIVIGGKAISLGIANDGSGTTLMPFAREGWLNSKLESFPKPAEKVRSSQP